MSRTVERLPFGANVVMGGVEFRVWAPASDTVDVVLYGPDAERVEPLAAEGGGWFGGIVPGAGAGSRYKYRLNGGDAFPDPASRSQPDGVHDASEVVDPSTYRWADGDWRGLGDDDDLVIYEVHVGTATEAGTFDALIHRLDEIVALGANAIEPMPIAEFPGARNWGYDGVFLYAPESSYGGPDGFRRLVDAAHARGLAVILDVVYNHLGPEGNYLHAVTGGQYFTSRHHTPWGDAIDYEQQPVREFAIQNAVHWAREYHVDGLRLDATHAILDESPTHVLTELAARAREAAAGRRFVVIAEDERNERGVVLPPPDGHGLDGVWADDFHHQVRRHTAGDNEAYFSDYTGSAAHVVETLRRGWFYEGQVSENHGAPRGTEATGLPPRAFVHCIQNHDQVGNRAMGDRLTETVPLTVYRAASALLLLSPYTPLLWMGQEWAATTPFQYFTDHPEELGKLVTEGRRKEFGKFSAFADPAVRERIPDPQAPSTFENSRLRWSERERMPHAGVLALYRELLRLRRMHPSLQTRGRDAFHAVALGDSTVALRRTARDGRALLLVANFEGAVDVDLSAHAETRALDVSGWDLLLSTEEGRFGGDAEGELVRLSPDGRLAMRGPGAVVLEGGPRPG